MCPPVPRRDVLHDLERFADRVGLAVQIRDDILDIEGPTEIIGKQQGADLAHDKATYPALFGMDRAKERVAELEAAALQALESLGDAAEGLRCLARMIAERET